MIGNIKNLRVRVHQVGWITSWLADLIQENKQNIILNFENDTWRVYSNKRALATPVRRYVQTIPDSFCVGTNTTLDRASVHT